MAENVDLKAAMDRLTILRSAHAALTDFGVSFDVMALLAVADWLAGEGIICSAEGATSDADAEEEADG